LEEEIDLRPYFEALITNWKWIIGAAIGAAVVALGISFLIPPTYEATALVAVTEPDQLVQFDPRFEALDETQPLKAYPELATSDQLLLSLLDVTDITLENIKNVEQLRSIVEAESGSDPSLVRLTVRYGNAREVANLTNKWADIFVRRINEIFGDQGGAQVTFFEEQLAEAKLELETAEQALVDFQTRNRTSIIGNELVSLRQEHGDNLTQLRDIKFLFQDIRGLHDQMAEQTGNESITFADQLTSLLLQIKTFNAPNALQFQIDSAVSLTTESREEQITFLENLITTLEKKSTQIDARLLELEPQILELQKEKQEIDTEGNRLNRDYEVFNETYNALARKVKEERITSQNTNSGVRLASKAVIPDEPASPRKLLNTLAASLLGFTFAVFGVFAKQWWTVKEVDPRKGVEANS